MMPAAIEIPRARVARRLSSAARRLRRLRRPEQGAYGRAASRALCVALAVLMLGVQTPATPLVLSGFASQWRWSLASWAGPGGLSALLGLAAPPPSRKQEKQADRDARVSSIRVTPGDATAYTGARLHFAAVAYDQSGAPVSGVRFKWRAFDAESNRPVRISRFGDFETRVEGAFKIVAEAAGRTAEATLKVTAVEHGQPGVAPTQGRPVSTRDLPADYTPEARLKTSPKRRRARRSGEVSFVKASYESAAAAPAAVEPAAAPYRLPNYEWNQDNYPYADDPGNGRGDPPGTPQDDGAGSGNFQIVAPVLTLPGRGPNVSLSLVYNSRVWSKTSSYEMTYDADRDWPAPGWSLGFGKMIGMSGGGSLLVDPDGTRHGFYGVPSGSGSWVSFTMHTTDGTFTDYSSSSYNGVIQWGSARFANGAVIDYGAPGGGAVYPTRVTDANGNFVTVTYRNNSGPQIDSVTDTLGRVITFHYDSGGLLTAVTSPGLQAGALRTLMRLHYSQATLGPCFSGLTPRTRGTVVPVVDAIYYPGSNTGYWFGDGDSYLANFGMIQKVSENRGMVFSGPAPVPPSQGPTEQGTIAGGAMTRVSTYNYAEVGTCPADAPTYTRLTQQWEGMETPPAVTSYAVYQNATNPSQPSIPSRKVEITMPNENKSVQYSYNYTSLPDSDARKFKDGLVYQEEMRSPTGALLQGHTVAWEQGAYESPRTLHTEASDERGDVTGTEFTYGPSYNQVAEIRSYDYGYVYGNTGGNRLLSHSVTQYVTAAGYANRHILSLPSVVVTYGPDDVTPVSRTEFLYDGATATTGPTGASLKQLPANLLQHDNSYDPNDQYWVEGYWDEQCDEMYFRCRRIWVPGHYESGYNPATDYRGNVTSMTSYADAAGLGGPQTETRRYDIAGNMVSTSTSCCEETSFNYTDDTHFGYALTQTRGSSDTASPLRVTSGATYNLNTGVVLSQTDPDGHVTDTVYDPDTLRPRRVTNVSTGSYTEDVYDDYAMSVAETTYLGAADGGAAAGRNVKYADGLGHVRREESLGAGGVWDVVETKHDIMGRLSQQSIPYRAGQTPSWSTITYDALGRTQSVESPDGSTTRTIYNEADRRPDVVADGPGATTRMIDAWGREKWSRSDSQGRLVAVVEPNPQGADGSVAAGGLLTTYSYDTMGNLIQINQGAQQRRFRYDSLGRLTHQKLAEAAATLGGTGQYVGAGGEWSDVYTYDARSNVASRTDARGVVTSFDYGSDPLNRLQSVTYTVGAQHDTSSTIDAAATVSYEYVGGGDRDRVWKVRTAGVSTEEFGYDSEGRVSSRELRLDSRPSQPLRTDYAYDTLGRVRDVTYPAQYQLGVTNPARKVVHYDYDVAGRAGGLKVGGVDYASQITYNASSQTTSLKVGTGANQVTERYDYDPLSGLLAGQRVYRGTNPEQNKLLHLSYDYLRRGTTSGQTGQLTGMTNHLEGQKGRGYAYDPLGRLARVTGGDPATATPLWSQDYSYDRYGNRTGVVAAGSYQTAALKPDGLKPESGKAASAPFVEVASNATPAAVPAGPRLDGRRAVSDAPDRTPLYDPAPSASAAANAALASAALIAAPTALAVAATSNAQINLSWTAPAAAVDHYEVERSSSAGGAYAYVGSSATPAYTDGGVSAGSAYLYRVRAVDAGGARSSSSNIALATAITFTDDPLVAGSAAMKAQHLSELRQAVNAVRRLAGLADAAWTDAAPAPRVTAIKAVHVQELRDRLNEALTVIGVATSPFTDPVLSAGATSIKKAHVEELRQRASRGSKSASPPLSVPVPRDGLASLSYDAASNRITSDGWAYDASGNQTRVRTADSGWQRMRYDAANRLVRVTSDDGAQVYSSYTYADSNARLMTQEGATRTYYVWAGEGVTAEYTETDGTGSAASPQWSKNYVYLGSRLLATQQQTATGEYVQYHHADRVGTRLVTNASDATYFEQTGLPFGTAFESESPAATGRRFTSYDHSYGTGLDYAVNRHYDAQQGRFTQVDPLGMKATSLLNPQTLNLYAYCGNDPVNRTDPSGLFWGLGKFFKKLWKGVTAVARAISKVLNNKWVQLGFFVLDFVSLGLTSIAHLSGFAKTFSQILKFGLKWYGRIQSFVGKVQIADMLFKRQFKEFAKTLAWGAALAPLSMVTTALKRGAAKALFGGNFDELADLFTGAWGELKATLKDWKASWTRKDKKWHDWLVPFYGNFCGPGHGLNHEQFSGIDDFDENNCYWHDDKSGTNTGSKALLDLRFAARAIFLGTKVHGVDFAFHNGSPTIGARYQFISIPSFGIRAVGHALGGLF